MTDIIADIIRREGGATETNDPADSGGRTKYGISERANPDLWADGDVSYKEARGRYAQRYLLPFEGIDNARLLQQLADWGVLSGPSTVVKVLQQLVGVAADGVLGPKSLTKVNAPPAGFLFGMPVPGEILLNLAIRDARIMFMAGLAKKRPKDLKYILGWLKRAMEFR